jgi:antitoxin ParD1/3/4
MPSSYSLGEHFEQFVQDQLGTGQYASASEVIRDALRLLEEHKQIQRAKLEALRAQIQKGIDSGGNRPAEDVFAGVRARIGQIAKEKARG